MRYLEQDNICKPLHAQLIGTSEIQKIFAQHWGSTRKDRVASTRWKQVLQANAKHLDWLVLFQKTTLPPGPNSYGGARSVWLRLTRSSSLVTLFYLWRFTTAGVFFFFRLEVFIVSSHGPLLKNVAMAHGTTGAHNWVTEFMLKEVNKLLDTLILVH